MEENTDKDYIDKQVTKFVNSKDFPEALQRLAEEVPFDVFRTLLIKYIKVITSILDKIFEMLGVEIENPDALEKNIEAATKKVDLMAKIVLEVLKDPTVKENIKQLAKALNDSALRPFLNAALVTMNEMQPAIGSAMDKVEEKVNKGIRKVVDSAGNAVLSGLGTVPYIGNILNATDTAANILMGVQAMIDTYTSLVLETTFRILLIMKKIKGPGLDAIDSIVDFGLNAYNTYLSVVAKIDEVNAMAKGAEFDPTQKLITKKDYVETIEKYAEDAGTVEKEDEETSEEPASDDKENTDEKPDEKPGEKSGDKPSEKPGEKPDEKPGEKPGEKPDVKPVGKPKQKGGAKSKKKHQKKRTRKGRFRQTRRRRGGNEQPLVEDENIEEAIKLPAAAPSPSPVENKSEKKEVVFSMGNVELNAKKSGLSSFLDKEENYKKVQKFLTKIHVSNVPTKQQIKSAINKSKKVIEFNKEDSNRSNIVKITTVLLPKLSKKVDILYDLTK